MRRPTPFKWHDGSVIIDPDVINAFRDDGVPEEIFREWIRLSFPEGCLSCKVLVARAFDNEHGTKTSDDFPEISDFPDFPRSAGDAAETLVFLDGD